MGRSKKKTTEKKQPKQKKDPRIQEIYEEEVTFMCPVRGLVTQTVKVKRYKPLDDQSSKHLMTSIDELTSKLEEEDDGLSIYNDGEELGITDAPEED